MPTLVAPAILDPRLHWALRRLGRRDYSPEIRLMAFQTLMEWGDVKNCRMALQAIVSCAMTPASPLFTRAQQFLMYCPTHDLVTIQEASRSREARRAIVQEMGERGLLGRILDGQCQLWMKMLDVPDSSGQPILVHFLGEITFPNEQIPFLTPPDDRPELWEACFRVQEDLPEHMLLAELQEQLSQPEILAHLELQRRALLFLPKDDVDAPEELLTLLAGHLDGLWPEIKRLIDLGDELERFSALGARRGWIIAILRRSLKDFPQAYVTAQCNDWTWAVLPELCNYFEKIGDIEIVVNLLIAYVGRERKDETQRLKGIDLPIFLRYRPKPVLDLFFARLSEALNPFLYYTLLWTSPHEKADWLKYFGPVVAAGTSNLYMTINYLELVNKDGREDLIGWLAAAPFSDQNKCSRGNESHWKELTERSIVPWGLSLGRWLFADQDALEKYTSWGYALSVEDLRLADQPIQTLLPLQDCDYTPRGTAPVPWGPWKNSHVRGTLFDYFKHLGSEYLPLRGASMKLVLLSLIRTAAGAGKLEQAWVIGPALEFLHCAFDSLEILYPDLPEYLPSFIDERLSTLSGNEEWIRTFLIAGLILWYAERASRAGLEFPEAICQIFRAKITADPALAKALVAIPAYRPAIGRLLTPDAQAELVLASEYFLREEPACGWWPWFQEAQETDRLRNYLVTNFRAVHFPEILRLDDGRKGFVHVPLPSQWLAWASYFMDDQEVQACVRLYLGVPQTKIRRLAERLLGHATS